MSTACWIALFFAAMWPILRKRRRSCAPGGSSFCSVLWIIGLLGICAFIYVKRNHVEITRLPAIQIPKLPPLPRIATSRFKNSPAPSEALSMPATRPTTQFTNQWVEDWAEFQKATHWSGFRAESSDTAVTEAEAHAQATEQAATTLSQMALADPSIDGASRASISQHLKDDLFSKLQSGAFIVDQFVRTTEKSYGTLYKSYLLIDTSDSTRAFLGSYAKAMLAQAQSNEVTTWASTAVLFLVIVLLYAFLNAATKGYYAGRLRAAALLGLIVGMLAVIAWGS